MMWVVGGHTYHITGGWLRVFSGGGLSFKVTRAGRKGCMLEAPTGDVLFSDGKQLGVVAPYGFAQFTAPPAPKAVFPATTLLAFHGDRLFGAVGDTLIYSDVRRYGQYHPERNVLRFPNQIQQLVSTGGALYARADNIVYYMEGTNPHKFVLHPIGYGGDK